MNLSMTSQIIHARRPQFAVHGDDMASTIWALALVPPMLIMAAVAAQPWVEPGDLLRDPLAVAEMRSDCCKVYFGAVSNLGVVTWFAGAAVALFTALVLFTQRTQIKAAAFFVAAGLFTGFLAFDDLFLVHENVLPAFGVPQKITYMAYALVAFAYFAIAWRQILQNRYRLLALAMALLGTSVGIDWVIHSDASWRILLEDGAKLTGIFAWTVFHVAAAWEAIAGRPAAPATPGA